MQIKEESKNKADYTAEVTQNRSTEKQGSQSGDKKRSTKSRTKQEEDRATRR